MQQLVTTKCYHVFTHNRDDWFDEYYIAYDVFKIWSEEYGSARLYEETYIDGELDSEDCLMAVGEFPW